jgi:hypothetical protein
MPTQTCGALQIDLATNALIRFRPKPNPAPGLHLFIYVFSAVSAALIYFRLGAVLQAAVILAVGIAISCALLAASRRLGGEFTFDKDDGMFRSGGKSIGRISDIHALQLISAYWIRGREETTRISNNWELNLVMKDGERRNITSHDDFDLMFRDATTLSLFVSKPIWQRRR